MTRRLGVLGWPVAHSRSPAMHQAAFAALGMSGWRYQLLPVPPQLFAETVSALPGSGFAGANVTIPHKEAALAAADSASAAAREIGAANTLTFNAAGEIAAENTDAAGVLAALGGSVRERTVLVLGAGGSARAVIWAFVNGGARQVSVWNRTAGRARALAVDLGAQAVPRPLAADILVNCTAVGLQPSASEREELNSLGLTIDQVGEYSHVIDLVYSAAQTALIAVAARQGVQTVDGLDVLVAQGALSFELWTGRRAPLEAMRAAVRADPASPGL